MFSITIFDNVSGYNIKVQLHLRFSVMNTLKSLNVIMFHCSHHDESNAYQFRWKSTQVFRALIVLIFSNSLLDVIVLSRIHSNHRTNPLPYPSPSAKTIRVSNSHTKIHHTPPTHTHTPSSVQFILNRCPEAIPTCDCSNH